MIAPTRVRDLAAYAAAIALIGWLAMRQWYGDLPRLTWFLPLSLLLVAGAEVLAANNLRDRIRRRPGAPAVEPIVAARSLALAKASALVGAVVVGAWGGLLVYAAPRVGELEAASADTRTATAGLLSGLALTAAALWLEYCCRSPTPPDSDRVARPDGADPS